LQPRAITLCVVQPARDRFTQVDDLLFLFQTPGRRALLLVTLAALFRFLPFAA
jgi:hypothetical protein